MINSMNRTDRLKPNTIANYTTNYSSNANPAPSNSLL